MRKIIGLVIILIFSFTIQLKSETNSEIWINDDIRLIHLQDSIFMHTSWDKNYEYSKGYEGSNGMILIKGGEALMVHTPNDDKKTRLISEHLQNSFGVTITKFIACYSHPDNIKGLEYLKRNGVASIANKLTIEKCKETGMPVPEIPFSESLSFDFNGEKVICRFFGGGHTFDNITVYLPEKKILYGGCLIKSLKATRIWVVPNQSVMNEWDVTVSRILKNYSSNLLVIPGNGNYGTEDLLKHTIKLAIQKKKLNNSQT